jgi:hypothetical protein
VLVRLIVIYSYDKLTKLCYNEFCRAQHDSVSRPSNLCFKAPPCPCIVLTKGFTVDLPSSSALNHNRFALPISPALLSKIWAQVYRMAPFMRSHFTKLQITCNYNFVTCGSVDDLTIHNSITHLPWMCAKWPATSRFCSPGSWTGFSVPLSGCWIR